MVEHKGYERFTFSDLLGGELWSIGPHPADGNSLDLLELVAGPTWWKVRLLCCRNRYPDLEAEAGGATSPGQ